MRVSTGCARRDHSLRDPQEYQRLQAAGQRFAAGILFSFFTLHAAVALAARTNYRRTGRAA
jgi:hypothetical protein